MKTKILVTGANGFIGRPLCEKLKKRGMWVRCAVREAPQEPISCDEVAVVGDITASTDWSKTVADIDIVIHLAARVHVMRESVRDPLSEFRRVNVQATRTLAQEAARKGVKRFIFMSTIKVNGEQTSVDVNGRFTRFTEKDIPHPSDAYSISKFEAEEALRAIERETGLALVILRPPLVYGPHVKANFLQLIKIVDSGIPLPFGSVKNLRSFMFLGNLTDIVCVCCQDARAAGKTFLVSDGYDVSSRQLIEHIARALGRKPRLITIPVACVRFIARLSGKKEAVSRLVDSLVVDNSMCVSALGWKAPYGFSEGMRLTVEEYRKP